MNIEALRNEIKGEYKYKIEMHAHTKPVSTCSEISPKEMVRIYSELGYDAITITNHFIYDYNVIPRDDKDNGIVRYMRDYYDTVNEGEKLGIKILLGAEIRFTENVNDYLIYGINEQMLSDIYDFLPYGIENFRKEYAMPNSVFVQAHPKRDGMTAIDLSLLDGVETMNLHQGHNSRIAIATKMANEAGIKIATAGSDFHHLNRGHEGAVALLSRVLPSDSFELAEILKSRDYFFEIGTRAIVLP